MEFRSARRRRATGTTWRRTTTQCRLGWCRRLPPLRCCWTWAFHVRSGSHGGARSHRRPNTGGQIAGSHAYSATVEDTAGAGPFRRRCARDRRNARIAKAWQSHRACGRRSKLPGEASSVAPMGIPVGATGEPEFAMPKRPSRADAGGLCRDACPANLCRNTAVLPNRADSIGAEINTRRVMISIA